ncbi:MAG: hypothetical protein ACREPI_10250 [Candidatus Dormibacterales bacterium]
MLGGLIESNLKVRPGRAGLLGRMGGKVGIDVTDAGEAVTLEFEEGIVRVRDGLAGKRRLTIHGDSVTVLELANLGVGPMGFPVYTDRAGRAVLGKLIGRRLRIEGLLAHQATLNRLARLFSVR